MQVDLKSIARQAGVSISTVSRAVNPATRGKVAPNTLRKIDALVKEFAYTPNLAAKNLRQSATRTIGLVFPYLPGIFYSSYYHHIMAAVSDYLKDTDYQFKLLLLKSDDKQWDQYNFKSGERVDGLIITHWFKFFSADAFKAMGIPCVVLNDVESDVPTQFVGVDHYIGGQLAANYLHAAGHRHIAVLAGPDWSRDSDQRVQGFKSRLEHLGVRIHPDFILRADFLEASAYEQIDRLFGKRSDVTALFCCNDQMAFGAIRRLKDLGLACPDDVSVIGYDDDPAAVSFSPPLTTVRVPMYDLARKAVSLLVGHLQTEQHDDGRFKGHVLLPVELIKRQSVRNISLP